MTHMNRFSENRKGALLWLVILGFFILGTTPGFCENKLIGQITNQITNAPIEHAKVGVFWVSDDDEGQLKRIASTFSDEKGGYEFKNLDPGDYQLRVEAPDYRMRIVPILVSSHESVTFTENVQLLKKEAEDFTGKQLKAREKLAEALTALEQQNSSGALKLMSKALDLDPTFAAAHNCIGIEYQKSGDAEKALASFTKASELDPQDPAPLINLGGLYVSLKKYSDALPVLRQAITLDPLTERGHALLGEALYRENQVQEAESVLLKAINLDPDGNSSLNLFLANIKMKAQAYPEARDYFQQYLLKNPDAPNKDKIQKNIDVINQGLSGQK